MRGGGPLWFGSLMHPIAMNRSCVSYLHAFLGLYTCTCTTVVPMYVRQTINEGHCG